MGFYPNKLTRKLSTWFGRTDTFELLLFPQLCANDFARIPEHLQQKSDFFIDRFRRSALSEAALLVVKDTGFIDVHDELGAEQARDVPKSVLGECGGPIPEVITIQILVDDLSQAPYPLLAGFRGVVKPCLQVPPSLLFRCFGNCLGRGLRRLPDQASREVKLVPPNYSSFEDCHPLLLFPREAPA
jgi:hypothetical protein